MEYISELAQATLEHERVRLGISPRGTIAMMRAAQALAACRGESYVTPDHVQELLTPVWAHRLILKGQTLSVGKAPEVLRMCADRVPVPAESQLRQ
jgi:MoxR-like ATPase